MLLVAMSDLGTSGGWLSPTRSPGDRAMAAKKRKALRERDLRGFKYFRLLGPLLEGLHDQATARDGAGNRLLHCDQLVSLLLLYFFSPVLTSLRGLQQASGLAKVQARLGCPRVGLGTLSEASHVFDPEALRPILAALAAEAVPVVAGREAEALRQLTAVDGSLLPALPRMAWALWQDADHRAAKLHVHFEVLKGVPCDATTTPGNGSEREQLRAMLRPDRLYVIDRGYVDYALFRRILDAGSSFIGRVYDDVAFRIAEERPIAAEAKSAGVIRDVVVSKLGTDHHKDELHQAVRLVFVATGKTRPDGTAEVLILCTDRLDLAAELVALGYQFRWAVELFFRWLKCILGCRHLIFESPRGVALQVYVALIASVLVSLWTGHKPTKRTFEMLCFYFSGMASRDELLAHIEKLRDQPKTKPRGP
jgi:Transposase DDE domain